MRRLGWVAILVASAPAWATTITQAPQLNVAPNQVTLWWQTDVASSTEVHFGPATQTTPAAYPRHSVWSTPNTTRHSRTLCNLAPGTYFYRVQSVDAGAQADRKSVV